jgi:hypothetical protein
MQAWNVETEVYLLRRQCDMSLATQLGLWLAHVQARQVYTRRSPLCGELHLGTRHAKATDLEVQILQGGLRTIGSPLSHGL